MALPGGRRDPDDEHLLATAVRETWEETGIHLHEAPLLGRLSELRPSSRNLPPLLIQPFVFGVDAGTEARVASAELDAVYWVSLGELRDPAIRGSLEIGLGKQGPKAFPTFEVHGETVWGLTHRILTELLELYESGR
jgi:8-oxo-dGTP pyrophosphatase MutT (NUDIX family)